MEAIREHRMWFGDKSTRRGKVKLGVEMHRPTVVSLLGCYMMESSAMDASPKLHLTSMNFGKEPNTRAIDVLSPLGGPLTHIGRRRRSAGASVGDEFTWEVRTLW